MKILRIVSSGYEEGGVENGIVVTNDIFRKLGHEVRVISSDSRPDVDHYSDYEFPEIPSRGVKKIVFTAFNFDALKLTKRVLADYNPDVVMLHTLQQPTASVLWLLNDYPSVLCVHGPERYTKALLPWQLKTTDYKSRVYDLSDLTMSGRLNYLYFRLVCGPFYKLGLRNVDKVVAFSNYTRRLLEQDNIKSEYIPNGVHLFEGSAIKDKSMNIVYAGRIEKYKGVEDIIKSMPLVLSRHKLCRLQIAGSGSQVNELKTMVHELGLNHAVEFKGKLTRDDLSTLYRDSLAAIVPSTWPETFGKSGVEAMSAGRPVVATNVGGITDWLEDGINGYIIKKSSPEDIAKKICLIIENRSRTLSMGKAARKTSESFGMASFAANLETLMSELVCKVTQP